MPTQTTELPDRWLLPLRGSQVVGINLGENVAFLLDSSVRIIVGYGACFTRGGLRAPGVEPVTLAQRDGSEIQRSVGTTVLSAVGFKIGAMRIVFDNGWFLTVGIKDKESFVPAAVISGDTVLWMRTAPSAHQS